MSELIDREAVREFIKSYRHSTDVALHMEEHLDEIPAAKRWHRVEEELPSDFQPVWAACKMDGRENWTIETIYDPYLSCPWGGIFPCWKAGRPLFMRGWIE